jgi:uncharacterized protein
VLTGFVVGAVEAAPGLVAGSHGRLLPLALSEWDTGNGDRLGAHGCRGSHRADWRSFQVTLDDVGDPRYLALRTFRRTGVGVVTAVWTARDSGRLLVVTDRDSGKAKRIRNDPLVEVCASDMRGRPAGAWVEARARFVDSDEDVARAVCRLRHKYGIQFRLASLVNRRSAGFGDTVIEIGPRE